MSNTTRWKVEERLSFDDEPLGIYSIWEENGGRIAELHHNDTAKATAAQIVREHNSHDILVRALERCVEDLEQWRSTYPVAAGQPDEALDDCSTNEIIKRAQLALKLAKGE